MPLRESFVKSAQVAQKEVEMLHVAQVESQAAGGGSEPESRTKGAEKGSSPTQLVPAVETVVPVGQVETHSPLLRYVPARQAEHVNWDRVDVVPKLSMPPAVHLAGRAVEGRDASEKPYGCFEIQKKRTNHRTRTSCCQRPSPRSTPLPSTSRSAPTPPSRKLPSWSSSQRKLR